MAERTGLEPATPCVTGRYSNQLNYRSTEFLCHHPDFHPGLLQFDAWQFPTLAWGDPTLPSALRRFTSEFGMGSGGTTALQPPGKFFVLCTQFFIASAALAALANLSHILQYAPSVASLAALLLRKLLRTTICNLS